jgi:PAS domain S-box-containing protein
MDSPGAILKKIFRPDGVPSPSRDDTVESLAEIREKLFDTILKVSLVVIVPAVISSLIRIPTIGFKPIMALQSASIPLLIGLYFFRRRISFPIRSFIFVSWVLVLGLVGLINFGLVGGGKIFLLAIAPLISAIIIGRRAGLITLAAAMAIMSAVAVLAMTGAITWDFDIRKYMVSYSSWIDQIIGAGIIIAAILFTISRIHSFLDSSILILEKRNREIGKAYTALEEETFKLCRAEEIRRQHEERFNAVVDYMPYVAIQTYDREGRVLSWNRATETIFGIEKDDALGMTLDKLMLTPEETSAFNRSLAAIDTTNEPGEPSEWSYNGKDGHEKILLSATFPIPGMSGSREFVCMDMDITERKYAEEKIISSLQEKEVLLKEIHHRVKNNLQLITSLLNLQAENKHNEALTEGFRDANNRIYSMALIHEQLYRSNNFSRIDIAHYLQTLTSELCRTVSASSGSVRMTFTMEPAYCGIDTAIPCGLIVNEIVSNALKYAFPDRSEPGEISISIHCREENIIVLSISDNGIGLPDHVEPQSVKTLGFQLITILVKQIKGTYAIHRNGGTRWEIVFPASIA